jgi:hypothetical protein
VVPTRPSSELEREGKPGFQLQHNRGYWLPHVKVGANVWEIVTASPSVPIRPTSRGHRREPIRRLNKPTTGKQLSNIPSTILLPIKRRQEQAVTLPIPKKSKLKIVNFYILMLDWSGL